MDATAANTKVTPKPRQIKLRFVGAGLIIVAAMLWLGISSFQSAAMYYLTVPEVLAQVASEGDAFHARTIRVSGPLHKESIEMDSKTMTVSFHLNEGGVMFPVKYTGVVPDTFHHSETVVIEGQHTKAGIFEATNILVKCPSKYEAAK